MLSDPLTHIRRIGDLIVWDGPKGCQLIAGLESIKESQHRIETAVSGIEHAQLAMSGTLHAVQTLSMATFGLTSLTTGFMVWRLNALNARLKTLQSSIADIEARLDARDRGR